MDESSKFIRPFIRWAGGKQNLVRHLLEHAPKHVPINKYWEPFLGAGSLFFANGFRNAELSDVNAHLINAYNQIKCDHKQVYKELQKLRKKASEEFYYKVRNDYNESLDQSNLLQAARFIYLVHTSFNGMYRVNRQGHYNVPFGKANPSLPTLNHLGEISKKLQGVTVKTSSYESILESITEGDFVYLDPPYPKLDHRDQFQQFTVNKFSEEHHGELAEFSNKLTKKGCLVMISNSNVPLISQLYKDWRMDEVPVVRYINCKSQRIKITELIIKNY